MEKLYKDARNLIDKVIQANLPGQAVRNALKNKTFSGNIYLLAIGKAAWTMAHSAWKELGDKIKKGIVITKYNHSFGDIPGLEIIEAGHPISDENSIAATEKAVSMAQNLSEGDELLFLVSGGGSALFEKPLPGLTLLDINKINSQLLACGADIIEINMIRKRLSSVKAGRFAQICAPAKVFTVVLSDVLGDRLDSISSGPASPDLSTVEEVLSIVEKYKLNISKTSDPVCVNEYLNKETPKSLDNTQTVITGSVRTLCNSAALIASEMGYTPHILCTEMNCEAREAGRMISAIAKQIDKAASYNEASGIYSESQRSEASNTENDILSEVASASAFKRPCAIIFGGETVVTVKGDGKGGRNQELVLSAAEGIEGIENLLIFSIGSDGTDGPTDAAGGIIDGGTIKRLKEKGIKLQETLNNNDSYKGLSAADALIITGPTGTNVNDLTVILCG